jgi:hypothetical protein
MLLDFKFDQSSVSTVEKSIETWHRITEAFKHTGAVKQYLGDNDICTDEVKDSIDEVSFDLFVYSRNENIFPRCVEIK